jgi:hypothetical protein
MAVDEEVFERWKKSKARKGRGAIGGIGKTFLALAVIVSLAITGLVLFLKAPEKRIATVQGHVVKLVDQEEWQEKVDKVEKKVRKRVHDEAGRDVDIDIDFDLPGRRVLVELDSGEKTDVALPEDQEVRAGAAVNLDVYRKVFGPLSLEFHKFAGYVEAVK